MSRYIVRNVATGPHTSKLRGHAQVFRISQATGFEHLSEHKARMAKKALRKLFAWGRDIGNNNNKRQRVEEGCATPTADRESGTFSSELCNGDFKRRCRGKL